MVLFKEKHIPKISFISSVAIVLLLVGILGGMLINEKQKDLKKNLQWIKKTYTAQQKELLKLDVNREIQYINILRESAETGNKNTQQDIISRLNALVPDKDAPEYFFIYKRHNTENTDDFITLLVNPNRPELVNRQSPLLVQNEKSFMFRKEVLKDIEEKGEAFVSYAYKKPGHQGLFQKLSFFKYLPEWEWIVAKGVYLDDLENQIARMQSDLYQEIKQTIGFLTLFIVVICGLFLGLAYLFSKGVGKLFEDYKKTQQSQQKKLEHLNAILEIQAYTDPLTQIYNRTFFNIQLEKEISRAKRYGTVLGLILFDIDNFKQINDTAGHLAGDRILKGITDLCKKNIRTSDIFARWGGEEFVVLVPESPDQAATALADKLRSCIEKTDFSFKSIITCSFGITEYKVQEDKEEFVHRADKALYHSKQTGKNRVTLL